MKRVLGPLICLALLCSSSSGAAAPASAAPGSVAPGSVAPVPSGADVHEPPVQPLGREAERSTPGQYLDLNVLRGIDGILYPRPGAGVRWGDSVLHLGLVLEGDYDSNPNLQRDGYEYATGFLRLVPRLSLSNRRVAAPRELEYVVGLVVDWLGIPSGEPVKDWGPVGVRGDVGLILRMDSLRFHLWDRVTRTSQSVVDAMPFIYGWPVRLHNAAEIGLTVTPPGSRMSYFAAYRFTLEMFADPRFDFASRMRHDLRLAVRRRFRPGLTLGLSVETGFVDHFEEADWWGFIGGPLSQNSVSLRAQVTADLQLGRRGRLRAALGYGGYFLNEAVFGDDARHHCVVGEVGGRFRLAPDTYLWAGYWHDFRSPYGGQRLRVDGAVLRLHVAKIRDLVFDVAGAWAMTGRLAYHEGFVENLQCEDAGSYARCTAINHFVQLSVQATGHLLPWLSVSVGYVLQASVNPIEAQSWVPVAMRYYPDFLRHRAFGRISVHY